MGYFDMIRWPSAVMVFAFTVRPFCCNRYCYLSVVIGTTLVFPKHKVFQMAGNILYLSQDANDLTGEGDEMWRTHFCPSSRVAYLIYSIAGGGYRPYLVSEIKLSPTGETQLAGADKQMQRE